MIDAISLQGSAASAYPFNQANLSAMRQRQMESMFKSADTDGDGAVSKDEFLSAAQKMQSEKPAPADAPSAEDVFKKIDADGNGFMSKGEFSAMLNSRPGSGRPAGAPVGGRPAGGGHSGSGPNAPAQAASASNSTSASASPSADPADTNGDGVVSLTELIAALNKEVGQSSGTQQGPALDVLA